MNLDLRNCDLKKNLDLRVIVATTDFLVHKMFDLRKIFFSEANSIFLGNLNSCRSYLIHRDLEQSRFLCLITAVQFG